MKHYAKTHSGHPWRGSKARHRRAKIAYLRRIEVGRWGIELRPMVEAWIVHRQKMGKRLEIEILRQAREKGVTPETFLQKFVRQVRR